MSWTDEQARRLRELRERAGHDRESLAWMCSVSVLQLRELEEGGHRYFYTPSIKAQAGTKVLRLLGDVHAVSVPAAVPARIGAEVVPSVQALVKRPKTSRYWAMLGLIGFALPLVLLGVNQRQAARDLGVSPAPPPAPQAMPMEPVAGASAAPAAPLPETSTKPTATPEAVCPQAPKDAVAYQSPKALKPATYVYVEADQESSICVVDGQQQHVRALIKPGAGAKIEGVAPFTLHATGWHGLRVFFQGMRVQLETAAEPTAVILKPL